MKYSTVIVTYNSEKHVWVLVRDWKVSTNSNVKIVVPAGFETDLATIPRITSPIRYSYEYSLEAPILHDYLYSVKGKIGDETLTRKQCDCLFYNMMTEKNVPWRARQIAYWSVRLFGWRYW